MADRDQSYTAKPGMNEKPQRDSAAKGGETGGGKTDPSRQGDRERVKAGGTVGRDVPDKSFQHNTEIAVEAGRKGEHRDDDKR